MERDVVSLAGLPKGIDRLSSIRGIQVADGRTQ
jgi:hypothetical protein